MSEQLDSDQYVLVVDDEERVRRSLRRILQSAGYRCREAGDVDAAVEILERDSIALVLSDIRMPGRSGLELVDHVKKLDPHTVCITVTAVDNTSVAVDALARGAYAYVIKPFDMNEILIQVESALRRRRLELAQKKLQSELERQVREQTKMIRHSREEIALRLISASQYRDTETGAHIRRLGLYTAKMAELMGMDQDTIDTLRVAAPMHDVGKIGIPDSILLKPGRLTKEEFEEMKRHTIIGASILRGSSTPLLQVAERIALEHHEWWDGSGYPYGLKGEDISLEARMVAVADVFDALTHDRVYKEAWPVDKALSLIEEESGTHFDPDVATLFLDHADTMQEIRLANPESDSLWEGQWQRSGTSPSLKYAPKPE
ncbi:response regulator [Persicimonas caeni]|uniref:Response regulator n=1 Tax=Persicimonas caeni TaxID=2292766 RepID=A0A4Y6PZK7_PERCE|nr:HD domain-containing phosphohydrolase [Persicimonas caeni]QDG53703.1 response regulator [Persicimonas caeni]QED34924.1 response regulator [Persicimonas caeni]